MMAPGPSSRAPRLLIRGEISPFGAPCVTVNVLPSIRILPLLAMVRGASCAWASADIDTLDIKATVAAAMIADLVRGADIELSCEAEQLLTTFACLALPACVVLFRFALLCLFLLASAGGRGAAARCHGVHGRVDRPD